jgi:tricorn protease-like protein
VSADGARIVTGSADNTARVWDAKTHLQLAVLKGHMNSVTSVAVSADGARIITGSDDNTVRVWDAKTHLQLAALKGHTGSVTSVAVSPDGARIVTGSSDSTARVWDAETFAELAVLKGHTGSVTKVAVTPDGARIVTGAGDTTARVWDAKTHLQLAALKGHTGWVESVAVSPDGARIVTGSSDGTARVWDAKTHLQLAVLKGHTGSVTSVAVSADGARIVTGSADNTARVWEVFPSGQALIDEAKALAPRCLTAAQRQLYHLVSAPPHWCETMQKWPYDALTLAEEHMRDGRHREAIAAFGKAIAFDPRAAGRLAPRLASVHDAIAWSAFLDVALKSKPADSLAEVLADADKAVALAPDAESNRATRGMIYLALERADEALVDLGWAIDKGLASAGTHYARGRAHELKGNRVAAIADYRQSVSLDPGDSDWRKHAQAQARERLVALGGPAERP